MDSKLQIISGTHRGRKLRLPAGARPTQNRARAALFNMLGSMGLNPNFVWDAFAGSGAFGIECLSRYTECRVVFTDLSIKTVRENLAAIAAGPRAIAIQADALACVAQYVSEVDLVFIDPPYSDAGLGAALVRRLGADAKSGLYVVWEQDSPSAILPEDDVWEILRDKQYGRARFIIMRRK